MNLLANVTRNEADPKILDTGPSSLSSGDRLARNLGWFSIGLGLVEMFGARGVARSLGVEGREGLIRAFGARELAAGILCLSVDKQLGLWSRAAGDSLDVAALLAARNRYNPERGNVTLALLAVMGITVVDVVAALAVSAQHRRTDRNRAVYRGRSGFPRGIEYARACAPTPVKADPASSVRL